MTVTLTGPLTCSVDEFYALTLLGGKGAVPTVLGFGASHTGMKDAAAQQSATSGLHSRGFLADGAVRGDVISILDALARPDLELALRLVTPDGMSRVTVIRRGSLGVLVRRTGSEVTLRCLADPVELGTMAHAMVAELPVARPASVEPVTAPLNELSELLDERGDPASLADGFRTLGAPARPALQLGVVLATQQAFAEIVCYALDVERDRISRVKAAVGVFYTSRGRVVGAPSASPTGQLWSTLKPGTDHAITQAIGQLVDFVEER